MEAKLITKSFKQSHNFFTSFLVFGLGALFYCYEYFLQISPMLISEHLREAYHLQLGELHHLVSYYCVTYVVMQVLVGALFDRFGAKNLFAGACALCAMGAYLLANAHTLLIAESAEILSGLGAAFAFVGLLKLSAECLPARFYGLAAGVVTAIGVLSMLVGEYGFSLLLHNEGWRNALLLLMGVGLLLALVLYLVLRRCDLLLERRLEKPLHFSELRHHLWQIVKNPQLWFIGLVGGCMFLSVAVFSQELGAGYFQVVERMSDVRAHFFAAALLLGVIVGAPLFGALSDLISRRRVFISLGAGGALFCLAVALYVPGLSRIGLFFLLFLAGLFVGAQSLSFVMAREAFSYRVPATAASLVNMMVMAAAGLCLPLVVHLLQCSPGISGLSFCWVGEYRVAFLLLPVSLVFAFLLSLYLIDTKGKLQDY